MASPEGNIKARDEVRLAELGYGQELRRSWGLLHNFGASFSIISVATGITTLFSYGLNTGGPGPMTIGWIVVNLFTFFVGLAMAEILSAIPTSGGPYFWAYMLAPQQQAPFFAWITGWFNLLGQVAVTTAIDFGLARLISETAQVTSGHKSTPGATLGILAVILVSHVLLNLLSIESLRFMIYSSVALNIGGVFCLGVAVLAKAPHHQSAAFVFGKFFDGTANTPSDVGWSVRASPAYVAVCGILMTQYTILGFDASAHLCEETRRAVRAGPLGMILSILGSAVIGFFMLIALLFSIQDFAAVQADDLPVLRIMTDACGKTGGLVLIIGVMLSIWHCGLFSLTSNSRMMFAFARDGGIPHKLHIIDAKFKSPIRTVMFGASCSFLLALPSLGSSTAFAGTTAIATIGLYLSYGVPIAMTLVWPENFKRGPFNLGAGSKVVAVVACLWISFITIILCLPTVNPVSADTLNYTPVAVGIVALFAFGSWFLWARRWFTGRCRHHCRVCIRQLDLLGEEMVYRTDTTDMDGHERLKSDTSGFQHGTPEEIVKPTTTRFASFTGQAGKASKSSRPIKTTRGKSDNQISVGREFEVSSVPASGYEEI